MDRKEILEKAQSQKGLDEMEVQVLQKGSMLAMSVGLILSMGLMVCKMLVGQPWQDLYCLYCAMTAVLHLYKRYRLKETHHLVWGLVWLALAIFLLVVYLAGLFA